MNYSLSFYSFEHNLSTGRRKIKARVLNKSFCGAINSNFQALYFDDQVSPRRLKSVANFMATAKTSHFLFIGLSLISH